jgi:hypothetical protein
MRSSTIRLVIVSVAPVFLTVASCATPRPHVPSPTAELSAGCTGQATLAVSNDTQQPLFIYELTSKAGASREVFAMEVAPGGVQRLGSPPQAGASYVAKAGRGPRAAVLAAERSPSYGVGGLVRFERGCDRP